MVKYYLTDLVRERDRGVNPKSLFFLTENQVGVRTNIFMLHVGGLLNVMTTTLTTI